MNSYLLKTTSVLILSFAIISCARPTGLIIYEPTITPSAGETTNPITNIRIEAFKETAYSFLRVQCRDCHSISKKLPNFAQENVVAAYAIAKKYVSLDFPEASELVARSMNGHCDEVNCMTDGTELRALVSKWVEVEVANSIPESQN